MREKGIYPKRKCFVEVSTKFYSLLNREKSMTGIALTLWYGL